MKSHYKITMTLIAGAAIGAAAVQGLHAQANPPAYVVVAIRSITDPASYKTVIEKAPAIIEAAGGEFVVRTDKITSLDGTPPKRFVMFSFDSVEQAQAWYNSAANKELNAIRAKSSDSLAFIVEGVAN
jgi:uncharacterized protein (DUF1330 family)